MQADVAEMEAMVGELLELERLRDGRGVQRTAVDLGALASDVARAFDGVPPGVDIEPHDAMVATVDESRIRMVLRNLIENAIKYSLADSAPVRVRLERRDGEVSIEVRDDGVGIPEADLAQVFVPFFRVDRSRSKKTGGYGLGLSICQRIAEAHGGRVTVDRVVPRGTRFTVTLPATGPAGGRVSQRAPDGAVERPIASTSRSMNAIPSSNERTRMRSSLPCARTSSGS